METPHTQGLRQEQCIVPVMLGMSQEVRIIREFVKKVGGTNHVVLIRGETGTGKEVVATLIHSNGRQDKPFVPVHCGSLTDSLMESDLFGHTASAFTGAQSVKKGLVEVAQDGTLFFDEVATMSVSLQVRLLRFLEDWSFRAVGSNREMRANIRLITATNANLEKLVSRGEFREDLYYRLNVINCVLPPLRDRVEDIPELAQYFLHREKGTVQQFTSDALTVMKDYHWPGNVRELKHAVERAAFHSPADKNIGAEYVKPYLTGVKKDANTQGEGGNELPTLEELQKNYLKRLLIKTHGNMAKAAAIAGITPHAMYRKVHKEFQLTGFVNSLKEPT